MAKAINVNKAHISQAVKKHLSSNLKEYIIVSLIFIVGVFFGVMFINNTETTQKDEITSYINNYISSAKDNAQINTPEAIKQNIASNSILAIALWFAGTTIIGIPIVFGIILIRGFCLGYTISACTYALGAGKGIFFVLMSILLQNILFIPALLALGVSGIKLYKSIIKDRRKENIKIEIIRHTIFSVVMLLILILAAVVKVSISGSLIENLIKYF